MSFKDTLRKSSFRGLKCYVENSTLNGGINRVTNDYLNTDEYKSSNNGLGPKEFNVNLYLLGDDIKSQLDSFLIALDKKDAGKLVLPFFRELNVEVITYNISYDNTQDGRMIKLNVSFLKVYSASASSNSKTLIVVEELRSSFEEDFDKEFDVLEQPKFVEDVAIEVNEKIKADTNQDSINLEDPVNSVNEAFDNIRIEKGIREAFDFSYEFLQFGEDLEDCGDATESRAQQQINTTHQKNSVRVAALYNTCININRVPFSSLTEAREKQEGINTCIDELFIEVDQKTGKTSKKLKYEVAKGLRENKNIERIQDYETPFAENSLLLSYKLYGDASQEPSILDLNSNIENPSFLPNELQVNTYA